MRVVLVSASLYGDGEQQMMRVVLALPPRLSCNTRVNFESRYGMNGFWNGRMRVYWNQSQMRGYKTNT